MAQVIAGVDIGSEAIKVARLRVGFRQLELEQILVLPRSDDSWPQVLEEVGGADMVVTALPGEQLSQRLLRLPWGAVKRLDQVVPLQLDGEIPFDIEDVVIAHRLQKREGDEVEVLAVAAARRRLEEHLKELSDVGIVPRLVVPGPVALASLAQVAYPGETLALADIGDVRTDIVVTREGTFFQGRSLPVAGRSITQALMKSLSLPEPQARAVKHHHGLTPPGGVDGGGELHRPNALPAAAEALQRLVRDLRQTLAAASVSSGEPVRRLVLFGGGSRFQGLDGFLQGELQVPVTYFTAPDGVANADRFDMLSGAKAFSLALQGARPRGERINLRQGPLAVEGEVRIGRGVLAYGAAIVVLLTSAWAFSSLARHYVLEQEKDVQYEALALQTKAILGHKLNSFAELRSLMAQSADREKAKSPIPQKDAFDIVQQISERIPQTINHEVEQLDIRSGRVQLMGRVDQRRDADEIMEALSAWEECFSKVPVPRTTPAVRDNRLQYTMDIESRCP